MTYGFPNQTQSPLPIESRYQQLSGTAGRPPSVPPKPNPQAGYLGRTVTSQQQQQQYMQHGGSPHEGIRSHQNNNSVSVKEKINRLKQQQLAPMVSRDKSSRDKTRTNADPGIASGSMNPLLRGAQTSDECTATQSRQLPGYHSVPFEPPQLTMRSLKSEIDTIKEEHQDFSKNLSHCFDRISVLEEKVKVDEREQSEERSLSPGVAKTKVETKDESVRVYTNGGEELHGSNIHASRDSMEKISELEKKNLELEEKSLELEEKSSELEKKSSELEEKNSELEKKSSELEEKSSELEKKLSLIHI